MTRRVKGYVIQYGDVYSICNAASLEHEQLTTILGAATLYDSPETAIRRVYDIGFWRGQRDWLSAPDAAPYKIVRVIETESAPAILEGWYIRRDNLWFAYGVWFTGKTTDATRFSGVGHAINALGDWKSAVLARGPLVEIGKAPIIIEYDAAQPALTHLRTEPL